MKKHNTRLCFIFVLNLMYCLSSAQVNDYKIERKIILSGSIFDKDNQGSTKEVYFYNIYNEQLYQNAEVIPMKVEKSSFKVTLQPEGEIAYIIFKGFDLKGIFRDIFMVQVGDSICLNTTETGDVFFTGKGSSKLNYQLWMGKQLRDSSKDFQDINDPQKIEYFKLRSSKIREKVMDSLISGKSNWDQTAFEVLKQNSMSAISSYYLNKISGLQHLNDHAYLKMLKEEIADMFIKETELTLSEPFTLKYAFLYEQYLVELNRCYMELFNNGKKVPFEYRYNLIKDHYSGILRDKLIASTFLSYVKQDTAVLDFLPEVVELVEDQYNKSILSAMLAAKIPGVKAFDFHLKNENGKVITLKDFEGKVVIMDTWFNGCPGCIGLKEVLEPIVDQYKGNDSVVFLSVNVDKSMEKFLEGVKSGRYTSEGSVNLYTNGLGQEHPMIKHYQYRGYPNLLIIDKNGFIISANPPRPVDKESRSKFIILIEKGLKNPVESYD